MEDKKNQKERYSTRKDNKRRKTDDSTNSDVLTSMKDASKDNMKDIDYSNKDSNLILR